jgi:hypothetical protein
MPSRKLGEEGFLTLVFCELLGLGVSGHGGGREQLVWEGSLVGINQSSSREYDIYWVTIVLEMERQALTGNIEELCSWVLYDFCSQRLKRLLLFVGTRGSRDDYEAINETPRAHHSESVHFER